MKQTSLTLEQIKKILAGEEATSYPKCLVMNELGEIYLSEGEPNAENELAKNLESEDLFKREIAASFLLVKKPTIEENAQKITAFIREKNEIVDNILITVRNSGIDPWIQGL